MLSRHHLSLFSTLVFLAMISVFFQNCTGQIRFSSASDSLESLKSGNGETYDGKLNGTYYRQIPNHQCEGLPAAYGVLDVNGANSTLTINTKEKCQAEIFQLRTEDLAVSPFFNGVAGWKEGPYERKERPPLFGMDTDILESWCRWDATANQGLDVVIRYDYNKDISRSQIIWGTKNPLSKQWTTSEVPSFEVNRDLILDPKQKNVSYSSSSFDLQIDLAEPAPSLPGLFKGRLRAVVDNVVYDKPVSCRMGAGLDGRSFRLKLTGASAKLNLASNKIINENTGPWNLTGACDVLLGNVIVSGDGLDQSAKTPCLPEDGGTFSINLNYDRNSPFLTSDLGSKTILVAQSPTAGDSTQIFKTLAASPPVFISTATELQAIPTKSGRIYILLNDIDLAAGGLPNSNFIPIGNADAMNPDPFEGVFEGNNKTLSNLDISMAQTKTGIGIFAYINRSVIRNLHLDHVKIIAANSKEVGTLAGQIRQTEISNCSATNIEVEGFANVGGLVGYQWDSNIRKSWTSGVVKGSLQVGGLVGLNWAGGISNSYAITQVTGDQNLGGLVGRRDYGTTGSLVINDSYTKGSVSGRIQVGGLIGNDDTGTEVRACYSVSEVAGVSQSGPLIGTNSRVSGPTGADTNQFTDLFYSKESPCSGCDVNFGTGVALEQLKDRHIFSNWDLLSPVWQVNDGASTPQLFYGE